MKYNDNGEYKDIYVKSYDTLPVGTEVDFDGNEVPSGWTAIESYSTNEIKTGENWIDGKPIYRKVINFGALPNATTKKVAHGISNYNCVRLYGTAISGYNSLPLPYVSDDNYRILLDINTDGVRINTFSADRSSYNGYIVVEYTKTTD